MILTLIASAVMQSRIGAEATRARRFLAGGCVAKRGDDCWETIVEGFGVVVWIGVWGFWGG